MYKLNVSKEVHRGWKKSTVKAKIANNIPYCLKIENTLEKYAMDILELQSHLKCN